MYLIKHLCDYKIFVSIMFRLKSVNDVYNILGAWLADLDTARMDTVSILQVLEETSMNDLVLNALRCHLRLKSKKGVSKNK